MVSPVLVIHGGAGSRPLSGERYDRFHQSLERILRAAYPALARGGPALNAVVRAVELLEDDPLYNAGKGSKIQSDGHIRMSAALMDGARRRFSGCVNVERVKNPIRLAKALLTGEDRVLAGRGGEAYARKLGLAFASPFTPEAVKKFNESRRGKTGTVGAIALDAKGRLAAATSTGGKGMEYPHRVSDSPTVAGNFANGACAVSATGTGEEIVEYAVACTICADVESGRTVDRAVQRLLKNATGKNFGVIALDKNGRYEAKSNTPQLIWAAATRDGFEFC